MTEADIKLAVADYLQYKQNAGELYYDRLQSGEFIEVRGGPRRRIKGCRAGTSDFFVIFTPWINPRIIFLECKGEKGRLRPEQKEFRDLVEAQGAEFWVIRNLDELITIIGADVDY